MTGSAYKRLETTKQWDHEDGEHFYQANKYSDHYVTVAVYDKGGFEQYAAEGYMHPSEKFDDTRLRLTDRINDEYFEGRKSNV